MLIFSNGFAKVRAAPRRAAPHARTDRLEPRLVCAGGSGPLRELRVSARARMSQIAGPGEEHAHISFIHFQ